MTVGKYRYPDSEDEYDPEPGYYCCLSPSCAHDRDQVFNGGGGLRPTEGAA